MKTIYSEEHRLHCGAKEIYDGALVEAFEKPERMDFILEQVRSTALGEIIPPQKFDDKYILDIHSPDYVEFLKTIWDNWTATGFDEPYARPLAFPMAGLRPKSSCAHGQLGCYSFDTSAPFVAGSWPAIRASADVALSGVEYVCGQDKTVFSLCRPPGHHAMHDKCGGYCYLNNAAIAAAAYLDKGAQRVSIFDIDYHHGNGTQSLFYQRSDVQFVSIHGDPDVEYPFYLGYEDEYGEGDGKGYNFNYPLPWGTDWAMYQHALKSALAEIESYQPDILIISLGVDTYSGDPISQFTLQHDDFPKIGYALATLKRPTHFIMEGGYAVEAIGKNVVNLLRAFELEV